MKKSRKKRQCDYDQTRDEGCAYFRIKHIGDPVYCAVQRQPSDEENKEDHIGKDRGKVHHLRFGKEMEDDLMM